MESSPRSAGGKLAQASPPADKPENGWYAFELDRVGMIAFSPFRVPDDVRHDLETRFGGTVRSGVCLTEPEDLHLWPDGAPRPEVVLCRSKRHPNEYRAFKYRADIDRAEFEEVGKTYAVFADWEKFARIFGRLDEVAAHSDPNESSEVDEVLRTIGRGSDSPQGN